MKIFNFFKKKKAIHNKEVLITINNSTQESIENITESKIIHPFIERCEYLKEQFGLIVPEVYKSFFTRYNIDENKGLYHPFWRSGEPYVHIFYTKKFIEYMIERYQAKYRKEFDQTKFQEIIEEGNYEFVMKENRFEAQHIDISFIDQCYAELGRDQNYLIIGLNIYATCGGAEFLILSSDKKGYFAGCYHGMDEEIEHEGIKINYEILDHYRLVSEEILNNIGSYKASNK